MKKALLRALMAQNTSDFKNQCSGLCTQTFKGVHGLRQVLRPRGPGLELRISCIGLDWNESSGLNLSG